MYQLQETLFEKLKDFIIPYKPEQKLFTKEVIHGFESFCVAHKVFKVTETTTWIGKVFPNSVSISTNFLDDSVILSEVNTCDLLSPFFDALQKLATQSRAQEIIKFLQNETKMRYKLADARNS